jgi:hypothetical protein
MRIVYACATIFPEAVAALEREGYPFDVVDVSSDNEAYARLWADMWHSGEDFLNVEQDMIVNPGMVKELEECPEEWCGGVYWLYGAAGSWAGVVRFRGELTRRHPDLPETIINRTWQSLDSAYINHLRLLGYPESHHHLPYVKHLVPKIYVGPQTGQFIQCRCGSAFGSEVFERNPLTCQECGAETWTPIPERTATDITL